MLITKKTRTMDLIHVSSSSLEEIEKEEVVKEILFYYQNCLTLEVYLDLEKKETVEKVLLFMKKYEENLPAFVKGD